MLTTVLDLVGALLVIAALSWFLTGLLGIYAGMLAAGVLILLLSWLIDRRASGKPWRRRKDGAR